MKEKVFRKIMMKIKSNMKQNQAKPALYYDEVKTYLKSLHERFVVFTINKAANNYALICKRF